MRDDEESEIRQVVRERLTHDLAPIGVAHG
jgi:hypothetical protein